METKEKHFLELVKELQGMLKQGNNLAVIQYIDNYNNNPNDLTIKRLDFDWLDKDLEEEDLKRIIK